MKTGGAERNAMNDLTRKVNEQRHQLLVNGFLPLPIPLLDKGCYVPGWTQVEVDPPMLDRWATERPDDLNTGIRCDGLLAVDVDLDEPDAAHAMRVFVEQSLGKTPCVRSREKTSRLLLLYRLEGSPVLRVPQWHDGVKGQGAELLYGSGRQIMAFGVHPSGASVLWGPQSPRTLSKADLPLVTEEALVTFADRLRLFMELHGPSWGLHPREEAHYGGGYKTVRDLTLETEFTVDLGDRSGEAMITAEGLLETLQPGETLRGSVIGLRPDTDGGTAQMSLGGGGNIIVSDHARGTAHMLPDAEIERYWLQRSNQIQQALSGVPGLRALREGVRKELNDRMRVVRAREVVYEVPPRPMPADGAWPAESPLADPGAFEAARPSPVPPGGLSDENYRDELVYVAAEDRFYHRTPVAGGSNTMEPKGLRALFGNEVYREWLKDLPPEQRAHDTWSRPDRPGLAVSTGPDGRRYFNKHYLPTPEMDREALLAASMTDLETSIQPFFEWVARVIPDDESREMFYDINAQKLQNPMDRPLSVIMVAEQEGVGRDTIFEALRKVFGSSYCVERPFERLNDRFNLDMETASWVHVQEIMDPGVSDRQYRAKMERVRETLKELFSPGRCLLRVEGKNVNARTVPVHFTGFITTNHASAVPVTSGSRRFLVIQNGRKPTKEEIASIRAWLENPMNCVALRMWLRERTITHDVFHAPALPAHLEAVEEVESRFKEATRSQPDEAADEFLDWCPTEAFTLAQFNRWVDLHNDLHSWRLQGDKDSGRLRYSMLRRSRPGGRLTHRGKQIRWRRKHGGSQKKRELTEEVVHGQLDQLDARLDAIAAEQRAELESAVQDAPRLDDDLSDLNLALPE